MTDRVRTGEHPDHPLISGGTEAGLGHRSADLPPPLDAALALPEVRAMREKAEAVIARWDSTDWKAAPTADVMNALRAALAALGDEG